MEQVMAAIGIIAEDETDCTAIAILVRRILGDENSKLFSLKKRAAGGCGELRRKAAAWMRELAHDGCDYVLLVHDLDRLPGGTSLCDKPTLENQLELIQVPQGIQRILVIPIEELEAWFWVDEAVLRIVAGERTKASPNPANIKKPKEKLIRLSRGTNKKPTFTTNDNPRLAEVLDLDLCASKCPEFAAMRTFITELTTKHRAA